MHQRRFTWLTAVITVVFASLLATPVLAANAHSHAIGAVMEAVDAHGHVHDDVGGDAHDAIDHAHDVPHLQLALILAIDSWLPDWPASVEVRIESWARSSPERPPRSTA
ncbi:hypothetical protein JP75_18995 [Devosia riboflavina]|uniref:Uncharacterized protein n=1 Tax=Devosia riboflavina TaxID=46914 RepID=A0A087LYI9_9HYPH|nr:hypothetical protein [Devosia riboflavina]KFL29692.1 hypothetical protein JP75_18995 [Devosia riboflavina]